MTARVRWTGSTTARGYGSPHQTLRAQRLAAYRPGDRCAIGGEPLNWWPVDVARKFIDLPHDHVNGGYLDGLACRNHNRGEGAARRNRMRGQQRAAAKTTARTIRAAPATAPLRTSRNW